MSEQAKKYIQESAWKIFPAQELWIKEDNTFWVYDWNRDEHTLFITNGKYENGDICFDIDEVMVSNDEDRTNSYINQLIETKRKEGFSCFASQLFV